MTSPTLSVTIRCDPRRLYALVSDPAQLPRWATTFCRSIRPADGSWIIDTPQGPTKLRMAGKNALGVVDHYVTPPGGAELVVPMRIVANEAGSELLFTLFRRPEMTDAQYAEDRRLVEQDLASLKRLMESA